MTRNVAKMWQDYAKSIGTTANNLTQAQKRQAEYLGIMEETRFQVGDAQKITETYSGKVSSLAFSFNNLKVALGNAIIPVLQAILPHITAAVNGLTKMANALASITGGIFGKAQIAETGKATDAVDETAGAVDGLTDSTKKAEKAAKRSLAPFDELNKTAGEISQSISEQPETPALPEIGPTVEETEERVNKMAEAIKRGFAVIAESARQSLGSIIDLIKSIGDSFSKVWENGVGVTMLQTIQSIIKNIIDYYGVLAERIKAAWEANGNGEAIWRSLLGIIQTVLSYVERVWSASVAWASQLNLEPIVSSFRGLLEAAEPFVALVLDGLAWAYENVLLPLGKWVIEKAAPAAIDLLSAAIDALTPVIEALKPFALWLWETFLVPIGEWTGAIVIDAINWLTDALTRFSGWARDNPEKIEQMGEVIFALLGGIVAYQAVHKISTVIGAIKTAFIGLASGFNAASIQAGLASIAFGAIILAVLELVKNWDKMTALEKTVGVLGAVAAAALAAAIAVGAFQSALTLGLAAAGIAAGIAAIAVAIASAQSRIPKVTGQQNPGLRQNQFSAFSTDKVPRLAQGAVIPPNREFLAVLGDQRNGTNVEAPLSTIEEAVERAMARNNGNQSRGGDIVLQIDGRTFARLINPLLGDENRRVGTSLVTGV